MDDAEFDHVSRAARVNGLTEGGWAAEAALVVATSQPLPEDGLARHALTELMDARTQVRRVGVNLNQAVAALNATGEPPLWLAQAVDIARKAITRLDDAAEAISSSARYSRPRQRTSS